MKLSYLLGHPSQVEDAAKRYGLTPRQLFLGCFLAGMKMRKQANQAWYLSLLREQGTPVRILPEDPFVSLPFAEALERVIDSLVPRKNQ
jgi:hypothetical protein